MSQNSNPVPRLDLAPKLSRPLSLWNPLDYLRLLYWVFFFPQALSFYIDTFGGNGFEEAKSLKDKWEWLCGNPIQRQLILQALTLIVTLPIIGNRLLEQEGFAVSWWGVGWSVMLGLGNILLASSVAVGVTFGVASGVASGVVSGVTLEVGFFVVIGMAVSRIARSVVFSIAIGVSVMLNAILGVMLGAILGVMLGVMLGVRLGASWGIVGGVAFSIVFGVVLGLVLGVVGGVASTHPEDWLFTLPFTLLKFRHRLTKYPHITFLPLPYLSSHIANWLRQDWETGVQNINELSRFTLQFIPVVESVNRVLAETPKEHLLYRIAQLTEEIYDWQLVRFASASLNKDLKLQVLAGLFFIIAFLPNRWQQLFNPRFVTEMRLDTPARAGAAGFWYLHEQKPEKAIEAFAVIRDFPYGEEMFTLAQVLAVFHQAREPDKIAAINVPNSPNQPCLHLPAWEGIAALRRVISGVQIIYQSASKSARSLALNRALGELKDILDGAENIPQAERKLIINIAQNWQTSLLEITGDIGNISITEPVINPYVIGDPVQTKLFVGREDIMRELKEFWVVKHHLQSVALYGHRRMGKTSILLNVGNILGAKVHLAYCNLLRVGDNPQGVGEVLMAVCDAIAKVVNISPPADADLLNLPYRTFERYLEQVIPTLEGGLIIALDEFEQIEELMTNGKIPQDLMGFLRGMVHMNPKIAFAFAGLHTLEEMTGNYFHPFFASINPIRVGFLSPGATRQILANPDDDFLLGYKPEAMDTIYELTHGQPYLVQLIGFLLVRRYNDLVFEMGKTLDPVFTRQDVEAVINDPDFFIKGRYYFTGVWGQSAQGATGQQEILKRLAPHPEGINLEAIIQATSMDETTLNEAIETLKRHDVIQETNQQYHIIVELFRRWVLENK